MLVYSVTVSIDETKADDFATWMLGTHIPDVMATGHFTAWRLVEVQDPAPEGPVRNFNAQYTTTEESLAAYIQQDASKLRQDVKDEFGDGFVAFRTLLREIGAGQKVQ